MSSLWPSASGLALTQLGGETAHGAPKSDAGERQIALDTLADIRAHRQRQQKEKEEAGEDWTDSGFEFTNPDGTPLHPTAVTDAAGHQRHLRPWACWRRSPP